jgi:hypothetical protein
VIPAATQTQSCANVLICVFCDFGLGRHDFERFETEAFFGREDIVGGFDRTKGLGSSFIAAHLRQIARQYDDHAHLGKHSEKSHPIQVFHRRSAELQIESMAANRHAVLGAGIRDTPAVRDVHLALARPEEHSTRRTIGRGGDPDESDVGYGSQHEQPPPRSRGLPQSQKRASIRE